MHNTQSTSLAVHSARKQSMIHKENLGSRNIKSPPNSPQRHDEPRWKRLNTLTGSGLLHKMKINEPRGHGKVFLRTSKTTSLGCSYLNTSKVRLTFHASNFIKRIQKGHLSLISTYHSTKLEVSAFSFSNNKNILWKTCSLGRSGVRIQKPFAWSTKCKFLASTT